MSTYLGDPLTEDSLGSDSKQAAGLSSHTDKTVEYQGEWEGDGEKLEGWNIITGKGGRV